MMRNRDTARSNYKPSDACEAAVSYAQPERCGSAADPGHVGAHQLGHTAFNTCSLPSPPHREHPILTDAMKKLFGRDKPKAAKVPPGDVPIEVRAISIPACYCADLAAAEPTCAHGTTT